MTALAQPAQQDELLQLSHSARYLHGGASFLRLVTWVVTILGLLGGAIVCGETDDNGSHYLVGLGIAVILGSLVQGAFLSVVAAIAKTYAKDRLFFVTTVRQQRGF